MNAILSQPRIRACGAYKHFFGEKILMPGEFTSPEQIKCPWGPHAARRMGRTTRRRPSLWSREGAWDTILTSESRPAAGRGVLHGAPQGGAALCAVKRFAAGPALRNIDDPPNTFR